MDPDLEWTEAYETGMPQIDAQHRALVQLVNRISVLSSSAEATACALHLFRYAREHFATEELLMREIGFPGLDAHLREHRELAIVLAEAIDGKLATPGQIEMLKAFLGTWLVDHIAGSDMQIRRFMERKPG